MRLLLWKPLHSDALFEYISQHFTVSEHPVFNQKSSFVNSNFTLVYVIVFSHLVCLF